MLCLSPQHCQHVAIPHWPCAHARSGMCKAPLSPRPPAHLCPSLVPFIPLCQIHFPSFIRCPSSLFPFLRPPAIHGPRTHRLSFLTTDITSTTHGIVAIPHWQMELMELCPDRSILLAVLSTNRSPFTGSNSKLSLPVPDSLHVLLSIPPSFTFSTLDLATKLLLVVWAGWHFGAVEAEVLGLVGRRWEG